MLGFSVARATVSRYMPTRSRRPGQSWRTFLRSQAMAFGHCEYAEERSGKDAGLHGHSYGAQLKRSGVAQIARLWGLDSGAAVPNHRTLEEFVCAPLNAIAQRSSALPPCPAAQAERHITVLGPRFRYEVHRVKRRRRHSSGRGQLKTSR